MEQLDALARYGRVTEEQKARLLRLAPDYSRPDFDALSEVLSGQVPGTEAYAPIVENDFVSPLDQPLSTFSIDVDTAAYANVRRFLEQDQWPPADAVRVEELVNYFAYTYPEPEGAHPFAVTLEAAACPWQPEHRLVRVGLKGQALQQAERPATTLVFLIDVSGSMRADNKLPLVKQSLRLLVEQLTENDRIAIVTYSNEAALRLDGTSGDRRDEILALIESLNADGSTNGAAGIQMAYDAAQRHFLERGTNRVILLTDGDFNVGVSDDEELVKMIEEKRKSGVFLSIFGFGMGNLKDAKLEKLADKGNGHYGYIDGLDEAKKVFVQDLTGTLYTIAKDVKLQVDFNPVEVGAYRLIGYENRALAAADFNNDAVDAGDIGAGHRVTALYEIVPASKLAPVEEAQPAQGVEPSKYVMRSNRRFRTTVASDPATAGAGSQKSEVGGQQSDDRNTAGKTSELSRSTINDQPSTSAELLTVRLRYKRPNSEESTRWDVALVDKGQQAAPSQDFAWSAAVASFGLLLRQSKYRGQASFDAVLETAQAAKGDDAAGHRREFIDLVLRAKSLWDRAHGVESPRAEQLTSLESRDRASVNGKYRELLDKLEASEDLAIYGPYHDYGRWEGTAYRGREGLPPGYWVYVHPHWYIWGELATP
jgi:Ca-activated chloride channel family protein